MKHVKENAAENVRQVLDQLPDGEFTNYMDDGSRIKVAIRVDRKSRHGVIDFTGSSAQSPGNFNAPKAVVIPGIEKVVRFTIRNAMVLRKLLFFLYHNDTRFQEPQK